MSPALPPGWGDLGEAGCPPGWPPGWPPGAPPGWPLGAPPGCPSACPFPTSAIPRTWLSVGVRPFSFSFGEACVKGPKSRCTLSDLSV